MEEKRFIPSRVPSPAEGNRLPREVLSGVPLRRDHGPQLGMEPAPRHQGSRLRGGPALLGVHLQLHYVSDRSLLRRSLQEPADRATVFSVLHEKSSQHVAGSTVRKWKQ